MLFISGVRVMPVIPTKINLKIFPGSGRPAAVFADPAGTEIKSHTGES